VSNSATSSVTYRSGSDTAPISAFNRPLLQHVSIMIRLKPQARRRRGHQEGRWNAFSSHVGNRNLVVCASIGI